MGKGSVVHPAFGGFKPPESNSGVGQILGFHGSCMAMCKCGAPFMIPIIPGQHAKAVCANCDTTHRVAAIQYHEPALPLDSDGKIDVAKMKPADLKIFFDSEKPLVQIPR